MKKIWLFFLVLFMVIIPNGRVYALENSFYEGEYITGEYIKKFKNGTGKYEQLRFFRRKEDNQAVYCIQLWETLSSNKLIEGYDSNQYIYANIDYSTWERIMLIAYYGYGYQNHTDDKWYAITQFMIWQETSPDSTIYFTKTLNGSRISKYEQEMNEINCLIQNHANLPSFYNHTYSVKYKESLTIEDTNRVLDRFNITEDSGIIVTKDNNTLSLTNTYMGDSQLILTNMGKRYSTVPIVYIDHNGQNLLAPGNYYPIYMVINVELPVTDIVIHKLDLDNQTSIPQGDARLVGSKFQLLDKDYQVITEKAIEQEGKLIFENIGYGSYYLKEIKAGEGYLLNSQVIPLGVESDHISVNFYNQVIQNEIIITKYLKNPLTEVTSVEEGAIFSIYDKRNQKIGSFVTDDTGMINTKLPYGTYIIKQELGAKNHTYVDDFQIEVKKNGEIQNFDLYNEEITANIKVIHVDSDSNLPILESGATFRIRNLDTNEYVKDKDQVLELKTDNNGNTPLIRLSVGKYQVEQITSVDGYYVNQDIFYFEINEEVSFLLDDKNNFYLEIEVPNQKMKSRIEIDKYIEYYLNDELQQIEQDFDLVIPIYASNDIYSKDGVKLYEKDEEVVNTILSNGKIVTPELVFGSYYLKDDKDNIISVLLNKLDSEKVELRERIYEYRTVYNEVIVEVPNTYSENANSPKFSILLIGLGLWMIGRKRHENS